MTGFHILAEQKEEITSCNFVLSVHLLVSGMTLQGACQKQPKAVYNVCNTFSTMFESRITTKHSPVPRVIVHALPH
jgi:hypothetical protein